MKIYSTLKKFLSSKFEISVAQLLVFIGVIVVLIFFPWNSFVTRDQAFKEREGLGIYELIRKVKSELARADSARVLLNEAPLFRLKDFEMEISFIVRERQSVSGKTEFDLISVEGLNEAESSNVQKLNLRWEALPDVIDTIYFEDDTITVKDTL